MTPPDPERREGVRALVGRWAAAALESNPLLLDVEHPPGSDRWILRMSGEDKAAITIWLTVRERTLHFETFFMPAPEAQQAACFEYLLRANQGLFAWKFAVGAEDAVFLVGQLPLDGIDEDELDRVVGSGWAYSERYFRSALRIGFPSVSRR